IEWHMETRYYRAELEFWVDSTERLPDAHIQSMQQWLDDPDKYPDDDTSALPIEDGVAELQEQLGEVVDALVFVFNPGRPETFADILPWARFARTYCPNVLLCVATGDSTCAEACKDAWFGWCVAAGWEWVDLTDSDPETEYTVARIREALAANEWPTMESKSQGTPAAASPAAEPSNPKDTLGVDGDEHEEWSRFDRIAGNIDPSRVEHLHRTMFASAGSDKGDVSAVLDQLREMREEISRLDPEQARIKAAELAMAATKRL
ncbi:hypothetical protein LPJ70_003458, partial [Coemansia sp. RSA 2708]